MKNALSTFEMTLIVTILLVLLAAAFADVGRDKRTNARVQEVSATWGLKTASISQQATIQQTAVRLELREMRLTIEALVDLVSELHAMEGEVSDAED